MANLKDTIVLGNLTVTGTINGTVSGASLPLAANGTRGGIQIGFASTENNRAVALDGEKAYISLPSRINQYKSTIENDPVYSGWYWYSNTSDTSAVAAFGSNAQAATLVSAYSDTWAGQLGISYYTDQVGFRRKQGSSTWGNWIELAKKSDCKNPTDYYWANVKVSSASSTSASPTFATMTATHASTDRISSKTGAGTKIYIGADCDRRYILYRTVTVGTSWTTIFTAFQTTGWYGACRVFLGSGTGHGGYVDLVHPKPNSALMVADGYNSTELKLQVSGMSLQAKVASGSSVLYVWGLGIDA